MVPNSTLLTLAIVDDIGAKKAELEAKGIEFYSDVNSVDEGVLAGCHANYFFTHPAKGRWPINDSFVERYYKRWNEYPNFQSEGAYVALYMLKTAIERANKSIGEFGPIFDALGLLSTSDPDAMKANMESRKENTAVAQERRQ